MSALAAFPIGALVVVCLVFGFVPGAVLRLIVRAFPAGDPRRSELQAELYAVPRFERPIWVFEQIELAIFEGLWGRLVWAATGRVIYRWHLGSAVKSHEKYPDTFWIPSEEEKDTIEPGSSVQLSFRLRKGGERMWVQVMDVDRDEIVGVLGNQPMGIPKLDRGDEIVFRREHVLKVRGPGWEADEGAPKRACLCECCFERWNGPNPVGIDEHDDG